MAAGLKTIIALWFVCIHTEAGVVVSPLATLKSARHRLSPRHPLLCPLPQLPHPPRSDHTCPCAITNLHLREIHES